MDEEWRVCTRDDRFEVSNLGRVRSWALQGPGGYRTRQPKAVTGSMVCGYMQVRLSGRKRAKIHTLVLEAFDRARMPWEQARHLNGNKLDNRIENLKWGTAKENVADRKLHGTDASGERNPRAKLKREDVVRILRDRRTHPEIAADYGVSRSMIGEIKRGANWKDVPRDAV